MSKGGIYGDRFGDGTPVELRKQIKEPPTNEGWMYACLQARMERDQLKAQCKVLEDALDTINVENDRAKRQFTNVSNGIIDEAIRAARKAMDQKEAIGE